MNRIIKFRAWDLEIKEMFYPSSISWKENIMWVSGAMGSYKFEYEINKPSAELMQYTGLKDKNGVEIYEGDIIESFNIDGTSEGLWEVYWSCDRWFLKNNNKSYDNGDYYRGDDIKWESNDYQTGVIVRGNKLEHPHLLNPTMEGTK